MNTQFKDSGVFYLIGKNSFLLQTCHIITNITPVTISNIYGSQSIEINLRMSESYFSLNSTGQDTPVINIKGKAYISWLLWKTEFQINSYHIISSDKNFEKNIDKIVDFDFGQTFYGTILENQYASGNDIVFTKSREREMLMLDCYFSIHTHPAAIFHILIYVYVMKYTLLN